MSIESTPRVGLFERLRAATDLEQVKKLSAEFSNFKNASEKTRRRVQRLVISKTKELSQV
jgi:hypothetical protein